MKSIINKIMTRSIMKILVFRLNRDFCPEFLWRASVYLVIIVLFIVTDVQTAVM